MFILEWKYHSSPTGIRVKSQRYDSLWYDSLCWYHVNKYWTALDEFVPYESRLGIMCTHPYLRVVGCVHHYFLWNLNNNIKQLILQVRHKFKASFKNIVQADCWSCLTFPHHIAKKLTTASLNGCWLPETSRSFHYWQPASIWRLVPWLANAPPYKKLARQPSHWINSGTREGREGECLKMCSHAKQCWL